MAQINYDANQAKACADKFTIAAKNLPENFNEVVKVFSKYAEKSGSNALMNRYREVQDIYNKKIIPVSEVLKSIGDKMLAKIEELEENDEKAVG